MAELKIRRNADNANINSFKQVWFKIKFMTFFTEQNRNKINSI